MMQRQFIPFGEFTPDQPDIGAGVAMARNCVARAKGYASINALAEASTALTGACLGGAFFKDKTGTNFNFAGDATKLYRLSGTLTYNNVSKAGNYAGVARWEFARWGDRVLAVSLAAAPQYFDMGSSTLFADLPGAPPKASTIAVIRDFIVLGNVNDGTPRKARIQWSGFNNSEQWTVSRATQSDFQDLLGDGGDIMRIVPGEYGLIFQEWSITRMSYVGAPVVFRFDEVERGRGTPASDSVCWDGQAVYYWGHDGFYVFDGQASRPLGEERIDQLILDDLDTARIADMSGAVASQSKLVMWAYPSKATGGKRIACYSLSANRWTIIDQDAERILEYAAAGFTLDELDAILANIDTASINVDSRAYQGGAVELAAFTSAHKVATFSGSPLVATLETGDLYSNGQLQFVRASRPVVEGGAATACTVAIGAKAEANDAITYAATTRSPQGEYLSRVKGRYIRAKVDISGGFSGAVGVDLFLRSAGRR